MTSSAGVAPTQLPADVTTFVGRRAERSRLRAMLSESRLVTLTGFGGLGKTRLALKVASDLRRNFADGTVFVPLAALSDPSWLSGQVAEAVGLQDRTQSTSPASALEFLQSRHLLLVLDNCEHVIEEVAIFTDTVLRTCPRVRVLATSREPLRIGGESVHQIEPLAIPPEDSSELPTDALLLFADRAKSTVPGFAIDAQNRPLIATICRRLEGIPLAIELVVGRLRSMSLLELNAELTEHWDLLTHGSRAAPQRHQTMSACIDWSFDLCTPQEQRLWATLSVFADGFELDGVREVAPESGTADTLLSLVDKSIVTTWEIDGVRRFRLLPPLRQRGISTLREQGRLFDVRRRHRDWCVDLARRAQEDWISPRQAEWIDQLKREAANIRLALEFCSLEEGEAEPGLMMGSYLLDYGLASGLFRQGRTWFDLLLGSATTPEIRSIALRTAIWWAAMQGDLERAAELVAEERSILDSLDGHRQALHTQSQALVALFSGEFGDAATLFKQSIAGLTQFGDVSQQVANLCLLGLNCTLMGDLEGALEAHSACIAITEPEGEHWYRSYSYWITGLAVAAGGDHERALSMQRDSLRLRTHIDDPLGMGLSYEAFALLATDKNPERAARLMGAAEAMWERSETSARELPGINAYHDDCIGRLVIELGEQAYQEAFAAGRRMGREEALAYALEEEPSRPPLSEPSPSAKPKVLTTREIEVAELVSQGMSNQEIADKLVISRRTVETHVEHILTKLGLTRRTQISAWLTES